MGKGAARPRCVERTARSVATHVGYVRANLGRAGLAIALALVAGPGAPADSSDPSLLDRAKRAVGLAPKTRAVELEKFGEFYDPKKYEECKKKVAPADQQCEYLILKRREQPEYWPYAGVPGPKLPDAPNPPVYRKGMDSKEYFKALCNAEAGEFIYRTVEDVEGVYQIRPRLLADGFELRDRYVMEDPYGYTEAEAQVPEVIYAGPKRYAFFEARTGVEWPRHADLEGKYRDASYFSKPKEGQTIRRYSGYDGREGKSRKKEYDTKPRARYGYTWREIKRPFDRENTIVGGELIVLDLQTNEVLGIRRGFIRSGNVRNVRGGIQWDIGTVCPRLTDRPGWPKDFDFTFWFLSKVLKPKTGITGGDDAAKRR